MAKSKGQIEAEISEALIKFEKEYMGRGSEETKTCIVDDVDGRTRYRPGNPHRSGLTFLFYWIGMARVSLGLGNKL
jgi:hypothetical protein